MRVFPDLAKILMDSPTMIHGFSGVFRRNQIPSDCHDAPNIHQFVVIMRISGMTLLRVWTFVGNCGVTPWHIHM